MKNLVSIVILVAVVWSISVLLQKDTYVGFYYPDASNLFYDIQSSETFDSLSDCRIWVDVQRLNYYAEGTVGDYECGKNCKLTGNKPYVCEETLR